jgi:ABC-type nitrate/sulfonate/bicarbonate transport system substrate-binding protein
MGQAFVRAISRGVEAIHADPEGSRAAMVKWTGLNPDLAGRIVWPVFETGISEQDLQTTIDLTQQYQLISRSITARDVISDLAPKG